MSESRSDARPLRIGIIGAGGIARSAHLPAYQHIEGAEVVALADVSAENAERVAEQFGVPDTYNDWRELLDRTDIDAVDVCTPNQVCKEPTIAACEAGKHVLVQKPMAPSLEDATAMIEAAKRNRVKLGVIFMGRFNAGNALVNRLVDAGLIGRVTALRTNTGHSGGLRLPETSWRRSFDNLAGSWSLLGVHSVDCLRHDRTPVTEGEEGRASLEVILAGYESAATEKFVHLKYQTW